MRGVVSAGHELTARAGVQMLEAGGNAFDAAVAAAFASFVVKKENMNSSEIRRLKILSV